MGCPHLPGALFVARDTAIGAVGMQEGILFRHALIEMEEIRVENQIADAVGDEADASRWLLFQGYPIFYGYYINSIHKIKAQNIICLTLIDR